MPGNALQSAKALVQHAQAHRLLRARRLPALRTGAASGEPTIYYLCPDFTRPSGGIRAIYRHVDILNEHGVAAAVLHHRRGFACTWFAHTTRVVSAESVTLSSADTLVVPEIYGPHLTDLPSIPRLMAFNQNAYLTFDRVPPGREVAYGRFEAVMTVSEDSAEYLRFAFPGLDVSVVTNAIDSSVFRPGDTAPGRQIASMPRKRPADAEQVMRLLSPRLREWEIVTVHGLTETETAAAMRSSAIFLAFGHQEGFGLPPAEAMASGCYVVGFHGFGGREIFDPAFSTPVEDGDVLGFARAVSEAMTLFADDPDALRSKGLAAADHVRRTFTIERQERELLTFFERSAA
jgi:glycosyltransferase involved in cell wall biosynthesis